MSLNRILRLVIIAAVAAGLVWLIISRPEQLAPSAAVAPFPQSLPEVEEAPLGRRQLDIQSWTTAAGSRVLFVQTEQIPMLYARLVFNAGSARDGDHAGLAMLTNAMLDQGADGLDVAALARGFEDLGARLGNSSHRDMALLTLATLSAPEFRDPALALLTRILARPDFPAGELARMKTQQLQALQRQKQVPGPQLSDVYNRALFGDHPYGIPSNGTEQSLPGIEPAQLAAFYRQYYTAGNAVIALVGDLSKTDAKRIAEQLSSALPTGERAPELPPAAALTEARQQHIEFPSTQTHILLGNQMIDRHHPDYPALYVGNKILGGGDFSAILMDEVRQKRGLVYGIYSSISPMAAAGPFTVSLQTANANAHDALVLTRQLIADFVANGPSEEQLKLAQDDLVGSYALSTASNSDIVAQLGVIGFYDLPLSYMDDFQQALQQVTAEQVREAFRQHLHPDTLLTVSIGPHDPNQAAAEDSAP